MSAYMPFLTGLESNERDDAWLAAVLRHTGWGLADQPLHPATATIAAR